MKVIVSFLLVFNVDPIPKHEKSKYTTKIKKNGEIIYNIYIF